MPAGRQRERQTARQIGERFDKPPARRWCRPGDASPGPGGRHNIDPLADRQQRFAGGLNRSGHLGHRTASGLAENVIRPAKPPGADWQGFSPWTREPFLNCSGETLASHWPLARPRSGKYFSVSFGSSFSWAYPISEVNVEIETILYPADIFMRRVTLPAI
jgi:hypothetical protein